MVREAIGGQCCVKVLFFFLSFVAKQIIGCAKCTSMAALHNKVLCPDGCLDCPDCPDCPDMDVLVCVQWVS